MGNAGRSVRSIRGWVVAAVTLAVMLGATTACGSSQSASDKAKSQVCDAKSNIQTQINDLKSLTVGTATISGVKTNLTAIQNDLKTIQSAIPNLSGDTKQQVQAANAAFKSQLSTTVSTLLTTTSITQAESQIQTAATTLASSYASAFDQVKC
jgi:hypothetical protein